MLEARDVPLSHFDVVVFLDIDAPFPGEVGTTLREHLPGTRGYIQAEGRFPTALANAIKEGQDLMLRFESRGAKLEIGIDVQDEVKAVIPPGKKETETSQQYDFTVKNAVYVTEEG